jgi:isocitrate dehydrogenase (NAD+)
MPSTPPLHTVTLIPGDGIGPEVTEATRRILDASGARVAWDVHDVGIEAAQRSGRQTLPDDAIESIRRNGVALKGPLTTPVGTGFRSANIGLRRRLGLFAQVRPCKWYPGVPAAFRDVDLVVIRETNEDLYAGIEFERSSEDALELIGWLAQRGKDVDPGAGISIKPISERAARRIVQFAFDYVRRTGRKKLTAVHKATVMKFTDGLFLGVAREVAAENQDIEFDDQLVDALAARLVQRPQDHDVLVTTNLYGDVLSDLAGGLIGGIGLVPGGNFGEQAALFEPGHGSAPKYAGRNKVNPLATALSGVLMLRHLGEHEAADRIEAAIAAVLAEGRSVTYDLKSSRDDPSAVGTSQVADAVIAKLRS